jgi:hypothetical protein
MPRIISLAPQINGCLSYLDTTAWFAQRLPAGARTDLQRYYPNRRLRIDRIWLRNPDGSRWSPGCYITPQRPSPPMLEALGRYARPSRLDLAVEYLTPNPKPLWQALVRRLRMRWCRSPRPFVVDSERGQSAYLGRRGDSRVTAFYTTTSKVTGEPCVRLEVRLLRSRALRAQQLDTADAIRRLDPGTLLDHNLRILDPYGSPVLLPADLRPDRLYWQLQPRPTTIINMTTSPPPTPPRPPIVHLQRRYASPHLQPR